MWWTGAGILALVFPAIAVAAGYQLVGYPGVPCGFLVAGIATWYVGRRLNRNPEDRDDDRNEHSWFSIPMQYWAILWVVFAVAQILNMLLGGLGSEELALRLAPGGLAVESPALALAAVPGPQHPGAYLASVTTGAWSYGFPARDGSSDGPCGSDVTSWNTRVGAGEGGTIMTEATSPERRLQIDVWADISCPWCYLGETRLEKAIADSPHADSIDLFLHSFELDPNLPTEPRPVPEYLAEKFGSTVEQVLRMESRMAEMAAAEGLPYQADRPQANSFDAHRVVQFAAEHGLAPELFHALQLTLFTGTPDTYSHARITEVAVGVGLDAVRVREVLAGTEYADAVRDDEREAAEIGVTGVPFTVFDGRLALPGAASPGDYASVIERAWARG